MARPALNPSYLGKWEYLLALNLGEREAFDNSLSADERTKPPSQRRMYRTLQWVSKELHLAHPGYKFCVRMNAHDPDRVFLYCTARDGKESTPPVHGPKGGANPGVQQWRQEQAKKRMRKQRQAEKAKELPAQLEAEREKLDAQRRTAGAVRHQLTNVNNTAADQQKQLVELVMAHARGAAVQVRAVIDGVLAWIDDPKPSFALPVGMYRLTPKAREWYAVVGRDGKITAIEHDITALPRHDPACRVHIREVLQED